METSQADWLIDTPRPCVKSELRLYRTVYCLKIWRLHFWHSFAVYSIYFRQGEHQTFQLTDARLPKHPVGCMSKEIWCHTLLE